MWRPRESRPLVSAVGGDPPSLAFACPLKFLLMAPLCFVVVAFLSPMGLDGLLAFFDFGFELVYEVVRSFVLRCSCNSGYGESQSFLSSPSSSSSALSIRSSWFKLLPLLALHRHNRRLRAPDQGLMTTMFDRVGGIHSTPRAACVSCSRFLEGAPLAWVVLVVAFPSLVRSFFARLLVPSTFYLPSFLLLVVAMSSLVRSPSSSLMSSLYACSTCTQPPPRSLAPSLCIHTTAASNTVGRSFGGGLQPGRCPGRVYLWYIGLGDFFPIVISSACSSGNMKEIEWAVCGSGFSKHTRRDDGAPGQEGARASVVLNHSRSWMSTGMCK
ncbi:hypothetical protein DFP72DRAFT_1048237 [Ephemerocybe angulata]|uniref:Transmembrane protein n=1 Tax=Ephemerocybe angulata TaxID=980116 RepID=A0A8H6HQR7_9AGAR|nr:hypothetical protein DFP72DRAFT_1048237 [Tulosesus angulatus]